MRFVHQLTQSTQGTAAPSSDPRASASGTRTVPDVLPLALPVDIATDSGWSRYLAELGALAALRPPDPPRRVLLGLRTGDLAAAVLAGSAIGALASYRRANPLNLVGRDDVGRRVSTFQSGAYDDDVLGGSHGDKLRVRTVTHTTYADVVRAARLVTCGSLPHRRRGQGAGEGGTREV